MKIKKNMQQTHFVDLLKKKEEEEEEEKGKKKQRLGMDPIF